MIDIEQCFDNNRTIILSILVSIFMSFLWVCGDSPWLGKNYFSTNGSRYSVVAKNYLRYGFLKTKFAPVQDYGVRFPENPNYYINHPPLLYFLITISFMIFGIHSWAARFVPIAASVGSLLLVYAVAKRWWGSLCATCAAFFFAFMPMTTIFGSLVNFEPPTTFFMLLAVYYYQRWFDMRTRRDLYLLGVSIFLVNFCDWGAFLLAPFLIVHQKICDRSGFDSSLVRILGGAVSLVMVLIFFQIHFVMDMSSVIMNKFISRSGSSGGYFSYPWWSFVRLAFFRSIFFFTPHLLIAAGAGVAVSFLPKNYAPKKVFLLLVLFFCVFFYTILFKHGFWDHDYWVYHASPFFALASAVFFSWFYERMRSKRLVLIGTVLFLLMFSVRSASAFKFYWGSVNRSERDWNIYFMAQSLNRIVGEDQEVIVTRRISPSFLYYLDRRRIISDDPSNIRRIIAQNSSYQYIISPVEMKELNRDLARSYPSKNYGDFLVFNTRAPRPVDQTVEKN